MQINCTATEQINCTATDRSVQDLIGEPFLVAPTNSFYGVLKTKKRLLVADLVGQLSLF